MFKRIAAIAVEGLIVLELAIVLHWILYEKTIAESLRTAVTSPAFLFPPVMLLCILRGR